MSLLDWLWRRFDRKREFPTPFEHPAPDAEKDWGKAIADVHRLYPKDNRNGLQPWDDDD